MTCKECRWSGNLKPLGDGWLADDFEMMSLQGTYSGLSSHHEHCHHLSTTELSLRLNPSLACSEPTREVAVKWKSPTPNIDQCHTIAITIATLQQLDRVLLSRLHGTIAHTAVHLAQAPSPLLICQIQEPSAS
ncbi:hypothetical protein HDV57DRAFT_243475 [Trichoderma longibrachiatum]